MRTKRGSSQNIRPWSVSCLSQLTVNNKDVTCAASTANTPTADSTQTNAYSKTSGMSISESALNMLADESPEINNKRHKFQGSTSSMKTPTPVSLILISFYFFRITI